ncbi:universal stress protein [Antarcticibacterium flavum]|uniref:Universal stress protein n=1 Tax=Antarcticibacterium flavum TaxID=2058175 RepID=A0A5B7WY87_9FLAO|nr:MULTISPECIES: universal stress protein [Antarcticibacterium]MCM4158918.1 universal stress protein [Antarcticibacterium sp. W02-3]QCY68174.1 universal stress protein [Antarcticibacterium flavum]
MKKVLIAIDYNPNSQEVAEKGHSLAKTMGAEVCLIHVMAQVAHYGMRYPTFMGYEGYDAGSVDINVANEMREVTKNYLETAANHLNDPGITTHLTEGDAANAILDYAKQWNADLIVIGTHSHSVLEKLFMGTVASKILEKTTIPVYVVPVKKDNT